MSEVAASKYTTITIEERPGIDIVSLDRPESLNAVTPTMIAELTSYLSSLHDKLEKQLALWRALNPK